MRRKKHKQTRRATNYFRINYGFHEPYKVLLDGNFIHATKAINLSDLATHIPKLLGGTCKLYTTKCVSRELKSMGAEFAASASAARAFPLHKCDHSSSSSKKRKKTVEGDEEEGGGAEEHEEDEEEEREEGAGAAGGSESGSGGGCVPAAQCIRAAIGKHNEGHWFVATQDAALRKELGKIPGCPLIFATVNGVHLETPSEVTRQKAKEAEEATRFVSRHEAAAEPLLRPEQLAELRRELRRHQAGAGTGGMPPPTTSARFRKNKAKGPNPLAAKKKAPKATKRPMTGSGAEAAAAAAAAQEQKLKQQPKKGREEGGKTRAAAPADAEVAAAAAKRRRKRAKQGPAGGAGGAAAED